ncbi:hypothetical protein PsYK624_116000 [Phanerochaete sordida]|uniref:Uncharacterized protein n=1 Tax=Phanerochaete sordida TaxID=48140 RepID=A0A9P3GIJ0_9APHY|nr:hypothetical protein PsYK624_116000 [Phanerochaete sordida]
MPAEEQWPVTFWKPVGTNKTCYFTSAIRTTCPPPCNTTSSEHLPHVRPLRVELPHNVPCFRTRQYRTVRTSATHTSSLSGFCAPHPSISTRLDIARTRGLHHAHRPTLRTSRGRTALEARAEL